MQRIAIREHLESSRRQIQEASAGSTSGRATAQALTRLAEDTVSHLYNSALQSRSEEDRQAIESSLALVALGGFARSELAPYSDIDLLFLHRSKSSPAVEAFIKEMVREIWDAGLALGHNVGAARELIQLASKEILPATAFLDARLLIGPAPLLENFVTKFRQHFRNGRGIDLYRRAIDAVREDQKKYGGTIHMLEPNVKRTPGGLRDIHLIRWCASAMHHVEDPVELEQRGFLGKGDAATLEAAHDFLLRLRADLHFHAGKLQDDLLRSEQVRIAKEWGYEETPAQLAVEQFMAEYFRHSTAIADIVERFIERTRPRTLMANARELFLSRRASDGVSIGPDRLVLAARRRRNVAESLEMILELAELAARHHVKFDHQLTEALRKQHLFGTETNPDQALSPEAAQLFLRFLEIPGTQHQILRSLHRVGVLSRIIPEFEHARNLLQFNAYHKYTVDEHTFVVLEHLESFVGRDDVIGRAYRAVKRRDLLHLAVLLHDLGKGHEEDHSLLGRGIAEKAAQRFGLNEEDTETLVFLVYRHLMLSDLAMKRDISDPKVWVSLGREVGDGQRLRMLFVLTCADIMGVGPGVFTRWTGDLIESLYRDTLSVLGDEEDARDSAAIYEKRRQSLLDRHKADESVRRLIEGLPRNYLAEVDLTEISEHLVVAAQLTAGEIDIITKHRPETKTTTYAVFTSESASAFPFSKICGGLAAHHLDVLRARIYTLADGTVIDLFDVRDTHYFGDPTPDRVQKVENTIRRIVNGNLSVSDALYSTRSSLFGARAGVQAQVDTRVSIDNECSECFTVIDVFTNNRRGLLYTLASSIAQLGLSVQYAKIATYEDEAADVFYVCQAGGGKITDCELLQRIEDRLRDDVHRLIKDPRAMGF